MFKIHLRVLYLFQSTSICPLTQLNLAGSYYQYFLILALFLSLENILRFPQPSCNILIFNHSKRMGHNYQFPFSLSPIPSIILPFKDVVQSVDKYMSSTQPAPITNISSYWHCFYHLKIYLVLPNLLAMSLYLITVNAWAITINVSINLKHLIPIYSQI